jgi:hypothetical protein
MGSGRVRSEGASPDELPISNEGKIALGRHFTDSCSDLQEISFLYSILRPRLDPLIAVPENRWAPKAIRPGERGL